MPVYALIGLWVVVAALIAVIVGTAAGVLSWVDDRRVARAVLVGGSACGAVLAFAVAVSALLT